MRTAEAGATGAARVGRLEAVVFDLDGVLIDSEQIWHAVRSEIAEEFGTTWSDEDSRACMGASSDDWAAYMIDRLELPLTRAQVKRLVFGRMLDAYGRSVPWLPGALEAVQLAASSYPLAIASGSPRQLIERVLCGSPVQDLFAAVVCSDDVPAGKPAPDVYLAAAQALGASPDRCACIEDSANGILAGRAAGMYVIAVPDGRRLPPAEVLSRADLVLSSLTGLARSVLFDGS